jgi:hypothetical protein
MRLRLLTLLALALPAALGLLGAPESATAAEPDQTARSPGPWVLPVPGAAEVEAFDAPEHRWSPGHRGIDLAAAPGTALVAPADGVVTLARRVAGVPVVVVAHGAVRSDRELRSTFEAATTDLPVGTLVRRGEAVGTVEEWAGHCAVPCLHWGVRRGLDYVDPMSLLHGPVRLLPVGPPVRRDGARAGRAREAVGDMSGATRRTAVPSAQDRRAISGEVTSVRAPEAGEVVAAAVVAGGAGWAGARTISRRRAAR